MPSQSSTIIAPNHQDHKVEGTSDLLADLMKTEFEKQKHRIALLEVQNRNQDEGIELLKMDNAQLHDQIDAMNDAKSNEVFPDNNAERSCNNDDDAVHGKIPSDKKKYPAKRAYRLIPPTLLL